MRPLRLPFGTTALRAVFAVWLCAMLAGCERDTVLLAEVNESEANQVIAALDRARVPARKQPGKDGVVSVIVDASQVAQAVDTLQAEGLPPERHAQMGEVFRKEGLISSPLEERARYLWALSQELSATVAQIDGVTKARVHVVLPERASGGAPAQPSSASVFIKHRPGYNLQSVVPQVKQLVSTGIPGLTDERVTVVLVVAQQPGQHPTPQKAQSPASAASAAAAAATQLMNASRLIAIASLAGGVLAIGALAFVGLRKRRTQVRVLRPVLQEPQVIP